jgi:AcrR family transcriptional regulator
MAKIGRRPGKQDTRADIVAAARASFADCGYERSSIRAIARRADVDPALVHHYFASKAALFVEALFMQSDPRVLAEEIHAERASPGAGRDLVRGFLSIWDRPTADGATPPFVSVVQAVSGSPQAADGLREFLMERIWTYVGRDEDPDVAAMRRSLIASQLFGLGWTRYILRLEPFASASTDQLADWVGPTLDRFLQAELPGSLPGALPGSLAGSG